MTKRNRISNRPWIVFALVIGCLTSVRLHAVIWDYSTTDGNNTISGQFETDGVFADTQGTGTHQFTISKWTSWKLNDVDIDYHENPPTSPATGDDSFEWIQSTESSPGRINPSPDSNQILSAVYSPLNIVALSFPGNISPNHLSRVRSFVEDPPAFTTSVDFTPTSTMLTPVPEPKEYALIFLLLLGGFVIVRQHNQSGT